MYSVLQTFSRFNPFFIFSSNLTPFSLPKACFSLFDHFKGYELVSKKPLVTCRCRKRNGAEEGYSCRWDGLADMRCECKFLTHSNILSIPFNTFCYIDARKAAVDYVNYCKLQIDCIV